VTDVTSDDEGYHWPGLGTPPCGLLSTMRAMHTMRAMGTMRALWTCGFIGENGRD
jgi:hypothetical protein